MSHNVAHNDGHLQEVTRRVNHESTIEEAWSIVGLKRGHLELTHGVATH